jgi:hypothetical protein
MYHGKGSIKIDGKEFLFYTWKKNKKEAEEYADWLRLRGHYARVIKRYPDGNLRYAIFARKVRTPCREIPRFHDDITLCDGSDEWCINGNCVSYKNITENEYQMLLEDIDIRKSLGVDFDNPDDFTRELLNYKRKAEKSLKRRESY